MQTTLAIKIERLLLVGSIGEYFEVESIDGSQVVLRWKDSKENIYVICELKPWDDVFGKPSFIREDLASVNAILKFVRFYDSKHEALLETDAASQESIEKLKSDGCITSCVGKCNARVEFV